MSTPAEDPHERDMGSSYMPSSHVAQSESEALSTESEAVPSTVEEEPLFPLNDSVSGPRLAGAILRIAVHETAQSPEVDDAPSPEVGDSQSDADTQDLLAGAAFAAMGSRRHRLSPDRLAEIQEQRDELPADSGVRPHARELCFYGRWLLLPILGLSGACPCLLFVVVLNRAFLAVANLEVLLVRTMYKEALAGDARSS
ncbi:hypothetical protein W97_05435 [Coniosporium apollinis CBS 100218]|uniref:Uncharacterized protein n=1 Tax=Coniosporium apollinis (strain CBS 100218) TaxID=1168221 RepID=R7YX13_CONA1|nr:uncharacterized protein W97_05435 [Coniosporium apollinis CBS 100218]EON66191.1 hypothetical protein W97_05435 [Coniosporium apollinis CBS 100218]